VTLGNQIALAGILTSDFTKLLVTLNVSGIYIVQMRLLPQSNQVRLVVGHVMNLVEPFTKPTTEAVFVNTEPPPTVLISNTENVADSLSNTRCGIGSATHMQHAQQSSS
jgi:hypothetical protein